MTTKKTVYSGNNLFNMNFGLYSFEDIDFNESKKNILDNFKAMFKDVLIKKLKAIGLRYEDLSYFSPKYYNYENDSIDLTISITDKQKLKKAILKHKDKINKELSNNKSYDGYISLTVEDINKELENLKNKDYEVDVLVLKVLLDFNNIFDIHEYLICGDNEDYED